MCVISGEVEEVADTKILVAPASNGQHQITVYCNKVSLKEQHGAMILPFPEGPCHIVEPHEWKSKGLFEDLDLVFPRARSMTYSARSLSANNFDSTPLKVFNVGSYSCSIAQNVYDLDRIQMQVFKLDPECLTFLRQYYPTGFGFVICILRQNADYHPFAYIHNLRPDRRLFVPTMHFHIHKSHTTSAWSSPFHTDDHSAVTYESKQLTSDWDHEIYSLGVSLEWPGGVMPSFSNNNYLIQNFLSSHYQPSLGVCNRSQDCGTAYKYRVKDYSQNHDLFSQPIAV